MRSAPADQPPSASLAQRMMVGKLASDDRRLQRLRQFDQQRLAGVGADATICEDHRVFGVDQQLGHGSDRSRISRRRAGRRVLRNMQFQICFDWSLLQIAIRDQDHGAHGRSDRQLVSAHGGFGEMR